MSELKHTRALNFGAVVQSIEVSKPEELVVSDPGLDAIGNAISGGIAGMLAVAAFYPLTIVSTRLQVQQKQAKATTTVKVEPTASTGDIAVDKPKPLVKPYKNTIDALQRIIQDEGVVGLYAGLKTALVGIGCSSAVYYYWYSFLQSFYKRRRGGKGENSALTNLMVATQAGVCNVVMTLPIWVINTRMQVNTSKTVTEHVQTLWAEEGPTGFYKGLIPSLILVSNPAVQFMAYEKLKSWLATAKSGNKKMNSLEVFVLGAIAKIVATLVTYPYLLVKSRLQMKGTDGYAKYHGTLDAIFSILQKEGPIGFYQGMSSKLIQTTLGAALLFLVREKIVTYTLAAVYKLKYGATRKPAMHA